MKRIFFSLLPALLMFAACEEMAKLEEELNGPKDAVVFVTSVDAFTKVSGSFFDEGEAIGITALSPINRTNVCYTVKGGSLTAADPICWLADQEDTTRFLAVYPFTSGQDPTQPFTFTVNADQTRGGDSSDLLTAAVTSTKQEGAVRLAFRHRMSKLVINVEGADVSAVTVENVPLAATVDINENRCRPTGSNGSVKAGKQADGTWAAIIAPPFDLAATVKVTTTDGKETVYRPERQDQLKPGWIASISIKAGEAPTPVETTYSYTIEEWYNVGTFAYTYGTEGSGLAEHNCMLYNNSTDEYFDMDYVGKGVWSINKVFAKNDRIILYVDNRFWGRGFESNFLQFNGLYQAMYTLFYWIPDFPCKATVTYDMLNEKLGIDYEDTWVDAGYVRIEGNLLQGLGFADRAVADTLVWQKNQYAESIYRAVGPFNYLKKNGVEVGENHIILDLAVKANETDNNVSFLVSDTGLQYALWLDEPDALVKVFIQGQSVYGTKEGNVITIPEGSVSVLWFEGPEDTVMNSEVKLTILN